MNEIKSFFYCFTKFMKCGKLFSALLIYFILSFYSLAREATIFVRTFKRFAHTV